MQAKPHGGEVPAYKPVDVNRSSIPTGRCTGPMQAVPRLEMQVSHTSSVPIGRCLGTKTKAAPELRAWEMQAFYISSVPVGRCTRPMQAASRLGGASIPHQQRPDWEVPAGVKNKSNVPIGRCTGLMQAASRLGGALDRCKQRPDWEVQASHTSSVPIGRCQRVPKTKCSVPTGRCKCCKIPSTM